MSTFMNLFEELNKLYEDDEKKVLAESVQEDGTRRVPSPIGGFYFIEDSANAYYKLVWRDKYVIAELDHGMLSVGKNWNEHIIDGYGADSLAAIRDFLFAYGEALQKHIWSSYGAFGTEEIRAYIEAGLKTGVIGRVAGDTLAEDADDDVAVDDEPVEDMEPDTEMEETEDTEEPRQLVLECAACGAISICAEADAQIDEETDLVNIEAACEQCEKAEGYKILGVLAPYTNDEPIDEAVEKEILTEGKFVDALKKAATRIGADAATIVRCFGELSKSEAASDLTAYIEDKAVLKALKSGNKTVLNSLTQDDIEELAKDIADYERDRAHRKATKDIDFLVLVRRNVWEDGKETYDAEVYATSKAALEKYRKEHLPYEKDEDIQIVSAKEAKKLTGTDITRSTERYIEDVEEGLFGFGKKKREEEERKRQEAEAKREADRKAAEERERQRQIDVAKSWADYDRRQAEYKRQARNYSPSSSSSSEPSNTPYAGVNYSGGDYF